MVALTPGIVIVSLIVLAALVLFATELVPVDITALGVMVTLMLVEPLSARLADAGLIAGQVTMIRPDRGFRGSPARRPSRCSRCSSSARGCARPASSRSSGASSAG